MRNREELLRLLEEIKWYNLGENKDLAGEFKWKLPQLLGDLRSGNIEPDALYTAIHLFGEADYRKAQPEVEKFLKSEDSELRKIALSVLGMHWYSKEHRTVYESVFLDKNDDEDNRAMAAGCLGSAFWESKDKKILSIMLSVFNDEQEDWYIRDSAYRAILHLWGVPPQKWPGAARKLDYGKDVDWELIKEIENYIRS